jgi:hypothetical protein
MQYDELTSDLESRGVRVSIETAPEFRGGLQEAHEIAVYVKDFAEAAVALAVVVAALKKHLRGNGSAPHGGSRSTQPTVGFCPRSSSRTTAQTHPEPSSTPFDLPPQVAP